MKNLIIVVACLPGTVIMVQLPWNLDEVAPFMRA